jgi:hypothetical protein
MAGIAAILALTACATSHELIGAARSPISPDQVQLFLERPAQKFEQIAVLNASSKRSFSFTAQGKADAVIRRLKDEAAKLGANGILLQEITDESSGSVDTGVGGNYEGPRGTIDLGFGVSALMLQRYGRAIAIYLEPERARTEQ